MCTKILLLSGLIGLSQFCYGQKHSPSFAITGNNGSAMWENIAEVDLLKVQIGNKLFDNSITKFSVIDAATKKVLPQTTQMINGKVTNIKQSPTATMVAAAAYDEVHNKLFFTPMRINELRWIDLDDKSQTIKTYSLSERKLINADVNEVPNQITRMCIGADGYGYALSNDAMHLIRFSTGRNITITDLGSVIDAGNKSTINSPCGGWGGDMVADANGNLYVVSAQHNIFKVNIETRVSSFITKLNDIPVEFTTNGAAVDEAGYLILGSANSTSGFYRVDPQTWKVEKLPSSGSPLNVSDLANSNLLFDTRANKPIVAINDFREIYNEKISAYPNPVSESMVRVNFEKQTKGNYSIQLMDQMGRVLLTRQVNVAGDNQMETLNIDQNVAQGFYLLRVTNSNKKVVLAKKLLID